MRKSRFSEEQIIGIIKEQEAGLPTAEEWTLVMIAGPAGGRSPPTRCPARRKGDSRRITVQQGKRGWLAVLSVGYEPVSTYTKTL
jgi:hypothetical protein